MISLFLSLLLNHHSTKTCCSAWFMVLERWVQLARKLMCNSTVRVWSVPVVLCSSHESHAVRSFLYCTVYACCIALYFSWGSIHTLTQYPASRTNQPVCTPAIDNVGFVRNLLGWMWSFCHLVVQYLCYLQMKLVTPCAVTCKISNVVC